jgi:heavy metal sensor kinase
MFSSIKIRLVVWLMAVLLSVFSSLGLILYYELREIVMGSVDQHLESEITLLSGILAKEIQHGHLEEGIMEITEASSGEYSVALSGHYYQLTTLDGTVLGRSASLSIPDKQLPARPTSFTPVYEHITGPRGEPLRMMTQSFRYPGVEATFQAAESLEQTHHLLNSFRNILLVAFPVVFLAAISGVYFFSGLSLKTLSIFSSQIGRITERNLSERVEDRNIDDELRPLAASFNTMLGQLEKAFARQREFLSDASHELRTPTAVIKSYCDVTLARERRAEEYLNALGKINETTVRMMGIIERILEASRLESKIHQLKIEEVDVRELLDEAMKLVRPYAAERGVNLSLDAGPVAQKTFGDRERLSEVFVNVIENAVKYTQPGGRVDVGVGAADKYVVATISDSGIGIPDDEKERIFDRFYRVDKSREEVPGTGLGLSIVKAIVDAHRGRIEVKSTVGKGSVFRIFLKGA